jgi:hypothetical protein
MDKTTKELRSRYRSLLENYLAEWEDTDDQGRVGVTKYLRGLATCEKCRLLAQSLKTNVPLKLTEIDWPRIRLEWAITWPDRSMLHEEIKSHDVLFDLVEPLLRAWIEHLADDAPDLDGLTPDARAVLLAMNELGAFCVEAKITQSDISQKVAELGEEIPKTRRDNAISLLRQYGYVDTKASTATWLTTRGQKAAESLKSSTKPD